MGSRRSLVSQVVHIAESCSALGRSKRTDRLNGKNSQQSNYAVLTKRDVKIFFKRLARDIKEHDPGVKMVRQIRPRHVQAFLDRNSGEWQANTCGTYVSLIRKFAEQANRTYGSCRMDFSKVQVNHWKPDPEQGANRGFTREEVARLCANMNPGSRAYLAPEITLRIGARCDELCSIRPQDIQLDRERYGIVRIVNGKGGKTREVPILNEQDRSFFQDLKETAERQGYGTIMGDISTRTVWNELAAAKERAGLTVGHPRGSNHLIRKCYAREQYELRRAQGLDKSQAWFQVQQLLGHGGSGNYDPNGNDRIRWDLFPVYIGEVKE